MVGESLLFLLGFLNSRLSEYFFSQIGTTTGVGTIRWLKYKIETLPIPKLLPKEQEPIVDIVNAILTKQAQGTDIGVLEHQLNYLFTHCLILQTKRLLLLKKLNLPLEKVFHQLIVDTIEKTSHLLFVHLPAYQYY